MHRPLLFLLLAAAAAAATDDAPDPALNARLLVSPASPPWAVLDLWRRKRVVVTCPAGVDVRVHTARTAAAAAAAPPAWCGWRRAAARVAAGALRRPALPPCVATLPTFRETVVVVVPTSRSASAEDCDVVIANAFDPILPLRLAGGIALFVAAPSLAASATFRISTGALAFSAAAAAVVAVVLVRSLPSKRALAAAVAVLGSGAATGARLLFGHWVPTLRDLASPRVAAGYACLSLGVGAALAYWYDDPAATKAHAILAAALRVAGVAAVVGGTSHPAVGAATAAALLAWLAGPRVRAAGGAAARAVAAVTPARKRLKSPPPQQRRRSSSAGFTRPPVPPLSAAAALPLPTDGDDGASPTPRWASATGGDEWVAPPRPTASPRRPPTASPPPRAPPSTTPSLVQRRPPPPGVPPSPLIARGLVLNEATGKTIKLGGATFNRLVLEGFVLDEGAGTLTPPPRRRDDAPPRGSTLRSGARRRG